MRWLRGLAVFVASVAVAGHTVGDEFRPGYPRLRVVEPVHGAAVVGGRTAVSWQVREPAVGEHVSVFLDGELLVITSAQDHGGMHLMGALHGVHELVVSLSPAPMKASRFILGALHGELVTVEFWSVGEDGGESISELASLRKTFLRWEQRLITLDHRARFAEQTMDSTKRLLRAACGTRELSPQPMALGCSTNCVFSHERRDSEFGHGRSDDVCPRKRCSATCCSISGRCVELEASSRGESHANVSMEEQRLHEAYNVLQDVRGRFSSRQFALHSAPVMQPSATATVIWMGRQYMGMEADYLEVVLDGAYRAAINDTDLSTYAPNALIIAQETFPVEGKPSFWGPFSEYLARFSTYGAQPPSVYPPRRPVFTSTQSEEALGHGGDGRRGVELREVEGGFRAAVMLTSDEKYLAPLEWLQHVHFLARNCWHPELHQYRQVVAIPFGIKSSFLLPSERAAGVHRSGECRSWADEAARPLRWNFVGNANCSSARRAVIDDVAASGGAGALGGVMILTHTFDDPIHGLVVSEYRALLASSRFTLCPEGVHVESYRLWEALEVWLRCARACHWQGVRKKKSRPEMHGCG